MRKAKIIGGVYGTPNGYHFIAMGETVEVLAERGNVCDVVGPGIEHGNPTPQCIDAKDLEFLD